MKEKTEGEEGGADCEESADKGREQEDRKDKAPEAPPQDRMIKRPPERKRL